MRLSVLLQIISRLFCICTLIFVDYCKIKNILFRIFFRFFSILSLGTPICQTTKFTNICANKNHRIEEVL